MLSQVLRATRSATQLTAATYKTAAMIGLFGLVSSVAIGIDPPPQALAAGLPTPAATRPLHDNGPFYFWRGMDMQPVTRPPVAVIGFPGRKGMLVERVQAGSPAARAGLKPGDDLTALDGMPIDAPRSLALAIADHCCGPTVRLAVLQDGHARVVELRQSATTQSGGYRKSPS